MKRILIFKLDEIAYNSTKLFAEVLGKELEKLGATVEYFDIKEHSDIAELEAYANNHYDCIVDFNSKLPGLVTEDDHYFMDDFEAPFVNYIVDHPVYHHKNLAYKLKNYNVVCLDDTHAEYIRKYYPHIKNVWVRPLGAIQAKDASPNPIEEKQWHERKHELLFMGTYLAPEEYRKVIDNLPPAMSNGIDKIIQIMLKDTSITYEEAVSRALANDGLEGMIEFHVYAQMMCLADVYVRAYFRDKVLNAFADTGINMTICGEKYDKSPIAAKPNVTILPQMNYVDSLAAMSDAKYVLNIMPWFKAGIHDRVVNAMINGAVSVSDDSLMMDAYFDRNGDYLRYSIADLNTVSEAVGFINQCEEQDSIEDNKENKGNKENKKNKGNKENKEDKAYNMDMHVTGGLSMAKRGRGKAAGMTFANVANDILKLVELDAQI